MKLVLSGYAGVGKSTILKNLKTDKPNVFIIPESAREVELSKDFYNIDDPKNIFFQKSILDNEIMKILLVFENNIKDVLFDRSIVDNLTFASIYYNEENINYIKIQKFIDDLRFKYNLDYIYDQKIFIKSTKDEYFIENNILNDPFRKKTTTPIASEFILNAENWEINYFKILNKFSGLYNKISLLDHFNDDPLFKEKINKIINKSF